MSQKKDETCLACGRPEVYRRGLCRSDHEKFLRARKKAVSEGINVDEWETDLVRQGVLLPDARTANDVFAASLQRFLDSRGVKSASSMPTPTSDDSDHEQSPGKPITSRAAAKPKKPKQSNVEADVSQGDGQTVQNKPKRKSG